jgi:hypothetical protein
MFIRVHTYAGWPLIINTDLIQSFGPELTPCNEGDFAVAMRSGKDIDDILDEDVKPTGKWRLYLTNEKAYITISTEEAERLEGILSEGA